ncbi:D-glycero-beta-D-manno-heptose 1,7-bisphosphate 7-phosphatase [Escherichia coli]
MKKPALFLDRDGVINVDHGYVHTPEKFEFVHGIFDVVLAANRAGYLVVVVTNQAGIGRGYYSETQFHALTDWMKTKFAERGGTIDAVYFCPYHPEYGIGEYRRESSFRKPAPGMLLQAKNELGIDLERSILIGDKPTDMAAGRAAGVGTLLHFYGEKNGNNSIITQLSQALPYLCTSASEGENKSLT